MLAADGRPLQTDLVRVRWALPVAGSSRSRNPSAPAPTECAPPQVPGPFGLLERRPAGACRDIRAGSQYSGRAEDRQNRKPCSVGIELGSGPIGAENRDRGAGARVLHPKFATLFTR
jgi:hypothetical protein